MNATVRQVAPTVFVGANFRTLDLLNPDPDDISFEMICEHLAKLNRYCGGTPGVVFSVAQHSVLCARAALTATGNRELAAYLLAHDFHEFVLSDEATPKKRALMAIMGGFGILAKHIADAFDMLTDRVDAAIHARAGLAWPPTPEMKAQIKKWDRVLLATEWRDLMRIPQPYPFEEPALPDVIVPHANWQDAANELYDYCRRYLPNGVA